MGNNKSSPSKGVPFNPAPPDNTPIKPMEKVRKALSTAHDDMSKSAGLASKFRHGLVRVHDSTSTRVSLYDYYDVDASAIGHGGTSEVVTVRHKKTKKKYACKIIALHRLSDHKKAQLLREMDIMRLLDHPNICKVHEIFQTEFKMFIVMELCTGGELFDRLETFSNMQMPEKYVRTLTEKILRAVQYLHKNGIIHRDIKLENFIFTSKKPSAEIKMIDFGFSRTYLEGEHMSSLVGTAFYIAPEVLEGDYTKQADLWSIGCLVFMLFTGEIPIPGATDAEVLQRIRAAKDQKVPYGYKASKKVRIQMSPEAIDFINQLMKVNPDERMDAETALHHPWIREKQASDKDTIQAKAKEYVDDSTAAHIAEFKSFTALKKTALLATAFHLDTEQLKSLGDEFAAVDANNSGTITEAELHQALKSRMSEEEIASVFQALDQDGTRQIKYSEFIAACIDEKTFLQQDMLLSAFNALDINSDGIITKDELHDLLGDGVDSAALDNLISQCDFENNGVINKKGFVRAMRGERVARI